MSSKTESKLYSLMKERKSVRAYDPEYKISKEELKELIEKATSAPSSSNLQPWRFLVFVDSDAKKTLKAIANNQEQVETASAVIAVLGNYEMHEKVEQIYSQNVAEGHMNEEIKNLVVGNTLKLYPNVSKEARMNIASFDAGLISMQIMLLAKESGLDTVTMGGFDKAKFAEEFDLPANTFPIVLIAIGKAAAPARGSSRLPIEELVSFI